MAGYQVAALSRLIEQFERMPGIGRKSAQRLAFYVLGLSDAEAKVSRSRFWMRMKKSTAAKFAAI